MCIDKNVHLTILKHEVLCRKSFAFINQFLEVSHVFMMHWLILEDSSNSFMVVVTVFSFTICK